MGGGGGRGEEQEYNTMSPTKARTQSTGSRDLRTFILMKLLKLLVVQTMTQKQTESVMATKLTRSYSTVKPYQVLKYTIQNTRLRQFNMKL